MQVNLRRLLHNRVELLLTFVMPVAFFSIFALIFGGGLSPGTTPRIKVVAVDEIDSAISRNIIEMLQENAGLRFMHANNPAAISRQQARSLVRRGSVPMAIVLNQQEQQIVVDLLSDTADQVAAQVAASLVARSLMIAEAQIAETQIAEVRHRAAQLTMPPNGEHPDNEIGQVSAAPVAPGKATVSERIQVVDVIGEGKSNPVVSLYAAGIAVMFLLFGATGGGGALLEEREAQTLDRLLSSRLSIDQLLLGKWFYMTLLGVMQVVVMFCWGQIVFGVDLLGHLDGFVMMTVVTASAASAFGLFLATLCRTRGQLNGLSVILVLSMSALGGSMVPRYLMSEQMRQYGLCTFNAWALDGFDKVFWRDLPVSALAPQLLVLMVSGFVFLAAARLLAIRWETD